MNIYIDFGRHKLTISSSFNFLSIFLRGADVTKGRGFSYEKVKVKKRSKYNTKKRRQFRYGYYIPVRDIINTFD